MPDDSPPTGSQRDPRTYLAAERTFLAWIRTGVALMGFGFVVARFGLFLRELQAGRQDQLQASPRLSLWIGIALVLIGVFVNLAATVRQGRLVEQLKRGEWEIKHQSSVGIAISVALAFVGVAMAIYLIVIR